jgi:hypothetical protein
MFSGQPTIVSGTSVAASVMAGWVAQLIAFIRAKPGMEKKTMGLLCSFSCF